MTAEERLFNWAYNNPKRMKMLHYTVMFGYTVVGFLWGITIGFMIFK